MITAVLDVSCNELYFPSIHSSSLHSLCLPDADVLASRLCAYSPHSAAKIKPSSSSGCTRSKGLYSLTNQQRDAVKSMQEVIASHISAIAGLAVDMDAAQIDREGVAPITEGSKPTEYAGMGDQAELEETAEETITSESLLAIYSNEILPAPPLESEQRMSSSTRSLTRSVVSGLSTHLPVVEDLRAPPMVNLSGELFADSDEDLFMERFRKTQVSKTLLWLRIHVIV